MEAIIAENATARWNNELRRAQWELEYESQQSAEYAELLATLREPHVHKDMKEGFIKVNLLKEIEKEWGVSSATDETLGFPVVEICDRRLTFDECLHLLARRWWKHHMMK